MMKTTRREPHTIMHKCEFMRQDEREIEMDNEGRGQSLELLSKLSQSNTEKIYVYHGLSYLLRFFVLTRAVYIE